MTLYTTTAKLLLLALLLYISNKNIYILFLSNLAQNHTCRMRTRDRGKLFVLPNEVFAAQIKERYFSWTFPLTHNKVPLNFISTRLSDCNVAPLSSAPIAHLTLFKQAGEDLWEHLTRLTLTSPRRPQAQEMHLVILMIKRIIYIADFIFKPFVMHTWSWESCMICGLRKMKW